MKGNEGSSRKFLYSDYKKDKTELPGKQFHSKGFHPNDNKNLIDLEGIWSIKDMILENGGKPNDGEATHHTSTTYYSRYGKYNNHAGKQPQQTVSSETGKENESGSGQWNRKGLDSTITQKVYQGTSHDPLDF